VLIKDKQLPRRLINVIHMLFSIAWRFKLTVGRISRQKLKGSQIVVLYHSKILLIQNTYRSGYYLPGGGLQRHEQPLDAAVRELKEETGISVLKAELELVGSFNYSIDGANICDWIYQTTLSKKTTTHIDPLEIREAQFIELNTARKLQCQPHVLNIIKALCITHLVGNE